MSNGKGSHGSKGVILLVATGAAFLTPFTGSSINVALPSIGREFSLNAVLLGWIPTLYLLAAAIFLVPFGRIADIYGRKRVFVYGVILHTASSLVLAFSPSVSFLIFFRLLQGVGAAMLFGTGTAILTSAFPPGERGKALGINVASVYTGLSLGPTLGGLLTQHFGWRSIFLATVPLGVAIIIAVFWKVKGEWAEAKGEKFDVVGSTIYGLALVAIIYGLSLLPAIRGGWLVLAGAIGLLAFIRWEMKAESPVLNINLFKENTVFSLSNLAALINYSATFAVGFLLSLYLQYIKGFSPSQAGLVLVAQPLVMALLSPLAGRLSDRIEPRWIASTGMALTTIGLAALSFLGQNTRFEFIMVTLALLGLGFALFSSPNVNAIMRSVDKRFYGVASGTLATMRLTGQMLSLAIALLLLALYVGRVQITPDYYPLFLKSVKAAFALFAFFCFGGIFASLARGRTRRE